MARAIGTGGRYATSPVNLKFDASSLDALSRDLLAASERLKVESRITLADIGERVTREARSIAASHGSSSIPPSISDPIPVQDGLAVSIRAGWGDVAIAGLWELGNRGSGKDDPTFEHPTFGKPPTQYQPRYPFFRPALKKTAYYRTKLLYQMWDRVLTPYRLTPTGAP